MRKTTKESERKIRILKFKSKFCEKFQNSQIKLKVLEEKLELRGKKSEYQVQCQNSEKNI